MDDERDELKTGGGRGARRAETWPGVDAVAAVRGAALRAGGCWARGCAEPGRVKAGRAVFCRDHWPEVRAWLAGDAAPSPDLSDLYDRREALVYVNDRLRARGLQPQAEGTFIKRLYEDLYPSRFEMEPLRLGKRTGEQITSGEYAHVMAFTRRMLDAFVARRAGEGAGPVRPTDAERDAFLAAPEAVAWLNEWWATRGVVYRVTRQMMAYHRRTGRLPAARIGKMDVYHVDDLAALGREVEAAGGWERRPKKAAWRR